MSKTLRYSTRDGQSSPLVTWGMRPSTVSAGNFTFCCSASSRMVVGRREPSKWTCRSVLGRRWISARVSLGMAECNAFGGPVLRVQLAHTVCHEPGIRLVLAVHAQAEEIG